MLIVKLHAVYLQSTGLVTRYRVKHIGMTTIDTADAYNIILK